jgi:hypothetical protein
VLGLPYCCKLVAFFIPDVVSNCHTISSKSLSIFIDLLAVSLAVFQLAAESFVRDFSKFSFTHFNASLIVLTHFQLVLVHHESHNIASTFLINSLVV